MQLLILLLAGGLLIHDALPRPVLEDGPTLWVVAAVVFGPMLILGFALWATCWASLKNVTPKTLRRVDRGLMVYRLMLIPWYALQLWVGELVWLRQSLGDWVLLDELLVMLPTLLLLVWSWWCYYPVDRRLRESSMIGRLDRGQAIYPVWTRGQYLLSQIRHQILLMLLPLAAILGWLEFADVYLMERLPEDEIFLSMLVTVAGPMVIFILAPLMIRYVFDTAPLPAGEVRDRLTAMCQTHRVRVRELLLWRTFGSMINAAVMGIFAPVRYIMLTDALLDSFPRDQVEAVMAHELAHIRKHHMFWLLLFGFATALALEGVIRIIFGEPTDLNPWWIASLTVAGLLWLTAFGWASRRMERQADAFAIVHLAKSAERQTIDPHSVGTMTLSLQRVADLNHIHTARRSWRHGSIRSRQDHLRSLLDKPFNHLPSDRAVRQVKLISLLLIAFTIATGSLLP